ncbi:citrate synthase family protein [Mycobacterium ulcerans str. Harvey]|uniref:citrate synthase (unknown stereospecificity) n=1 Tax=Mycobacterium ulcerans str. Harvey TaxID=1299332 RepID=A0ABN0QKE9_MYCUL|nr:citrate synthase family protein [Mycobacterium ulcerans str. Harvey]
MIEQVELTGDARGLVKGILDRGEKLMGFGHRVYRAEDPRARVLRATAKRLAAPRYEVAAALEQAPWPSCVSAVPTEPSRPMSISGPRSFWTSRRPANRMPAMFTCGRTVGWCAHILEQKRLRKLVRPSAIYVGPAPRTRSRSRAGPVLTTA